MLVRHDGCPADGPERWASVTSRKRVGEDLELLVTGQVIADVAIVQERAGRWHVAGLLDQQHDCNASATARVEYLPAFLSGHFSGRALVPAQVEYINIMELVDEADPEAIERV